MTVDEVREKYFFCLHLDITTLKCPALFKWSAGSRHVWYTENTTVFMFSDLRRLFHRSPLHIVVEFLHDSKPLFQNGCGVVWVVICGCPEEHREKTDYIRLVWRAWLFISRLWNSHNNFTLICVIELDFWVPQFHFGLWRLWWTNPTPLERDTGQNSQQLLHTVEQLHEALMNAYFG